MAWYRGTNSIQTSLAHIEAVGIPNRPDGMRLRLSAIPGLTRGDAADALLFPYFFQCPPLDEFARPRGFSFGRRTNYLGEEYIERGGRQLRQLTFNTLAVEWGSFTVQKAWNVPWLVGVLERISDSGYPVHLLATLPFEDDPIEDMEVVLESFTPTKKQGENDAEYLQLTFTEYNDPVTRRRGLSKHKSKYPFTIQLHKNGTYSVVGDPAQGGKAQIFNTKDEPLTLQVIAKYAYGKPSLARQVGLTQNPAIKDWGVSTPLIKHPRFKHGGKLIVFDPSRSKPAEVPTNG